MKFRPLCLLLLSLFVSATMTAQILKRDTIAPKKSVEVIRFGDDEPEEKAPHDKLGIIKTAPLTFIIGYLPFFYEREVTDWLGVQGGVGLTFKPAVSNLLSEFYSEIYETDCSTGDCGNYFDYSYRKGKVGLLLSLSPRLYFDNDGLEGSYLAPEIRVYNRRSSAQKPDPSVQYNIERLTDSFDEEKIRYTDLMVHYGWQTLYPNLTLELSVGVGIRKISGEWQVLQQNDFGYYYSETPKQSESKFHFNIGMRIGFQL